MTRAEQREHTRQSLLHAAADEFAERGYTAANLADVADRVGVTRGLLHFYFRTKRDLAIEIVSQFDEAWTPLLDKYEHWGGPRLEAMKWFTHEAAERFRTETTLRAAVRLTFEPDLVETKTRTPFESWVSHVAAQIRDGQTTEEFRSEISPESTALTLVAAYAGLHILPAEIDAPQDIHARIDNLWTIMEGHLCNPNFDAE